MTKNPDGRYPSAAAMARALRRYQDDRADGAEVPPARLAASPASAPRDRRRLVFVLGAALLLGLIAAVLYWSQRPVATAAAATAAAAAARA